MFTAKRRILAAAIGALSMGAATTWAADTTAQDAKIQELEAKVTALEAKQASNNQDLAATIDKVLRDAEKRSQLLATSGEMGAGYDQGFFIRAGEAWVLRPGVLFQFRNVTNYRTDVSSTSVTGGGDQMTNGFEIARMKLELEGNAFTRDLTYYFAWEGVANDGTLLLIDAWVKYMFADEFGIRAGQFRDMSTREYLVNDGRLLAVDRSLVDNIMGGSFAGYSQGVSLIYGNYNKNNPFNAELAFTDGIGQANADFTKHTFGGAPIENENQARIDWGFTGRVEYKAMGSWLAYRDFTAKDTKEDLLVFGAGGDWSQAGSGNLFLASIDAQYENTNGLGLYAAGLYQHIDQEFLGQNAAGETMENFGLLVQAGYMLNQQWEIFGRADAMWFDQVATANEDTFYELTIGVNYYLGANGSAGHRAKVTIDLTYLPNGSPLSVGQIDVLDNNGDHAEWMLRGQFQLWL